ncbi:MAG TPA: TetR family transcriptional regulator [Sporichthyaceae bacterium]|nr:TetR family transcriptional regulator [Sporichthyaceae bacterium]
MPRSLARGAKPQPRRDALLDAAVEVVGTHGLAGTTHRSVTEAAGVPLATASYYFSSIGELVAEALTRFVNARAAQMAIPDLGPLAEFLTPADIANSFADRIMDLPKAQRLAFYEVLVNAPRLPELAGPAKHALDTYRQAAQTGLRAVGGPADDRTARAFIALSLGMGLLHLVDPEGDDDRQLFEAIRDLFLGQEAAALDPDGIAARMARNAGQQAEHIEA